MNDCSDISNILLSFLTDTQPMDLPFARRRNCNHLIDGNKLDEKKNAELRPATNAFPPDSPILQIMILRTDSDHVIYKPMYTRPTNIPKKLNCLFF